MGMRQTVLCTQLWITWGEFTQPCAAPVYNLGKTQVGGVKAADR